MFYLVCGGASGIVFVVEKTGDVGEVTFLARNPEVTRQFSLLYCVGHFSPIEPGASIEDDLEGLWGSSNGDGTIVSNVLVVGERLRLEASFLMEPSSRLTVECS